MTSKVDKAVLASMRRPPVVIAERFAGSLRRAACVSKVTKFWFGPQLMTTSLGIPDLPAALKGRRAFLVETFQAKNMPQ
jgi:hypothetical protein